MDSARLVTQRAETQQNMRAAIDLMVKDISMAGAGLPSGGIQLPIGAGSSATKFACDQAGTCHVPAHNYPASNYMYGVIPGFSNGVEANAVVPAAPAAINDSITSIYADYNFPLWEYNVAFTVPGNGTGPSLWRRIRSTSRRLRPSIPPAAFRLAISSCSATTWVPQWAKSRASPRPPSLSRISIRSISIRTGPPPTTSRPFPAVANTVAYRLFAVTYYLTVPGGGQTPRLMRQVNGLTPVPVADDIINLQFAYDIYNSTTSALDANQPNPIGVGDSPNLMQKINIVVMGQSMINNGNKSQNLYLATSVSARNMAFRNRYQ